MSLKPSLKNDNIKVHSFAENNNQMPIWIMATVHKPQSLAINWKVKPEPDVFN